MIAPMIFDEDEIRNLALDFPAELREEINEACDLINCQGWFDLVRGASRCNEDEVRQFYANLSGVAPKSEATHSTACELHWDGDDQFFTIAKFSRFAGVPTHEGMKLTTKQSWPRHSTDSFKAVFPGMKVTKKSQSTSLLSLKMRICHAFVIKNIMPRETDHDRVTMCDTLILGEVARKIMCDTAQYMVFQMQQSVKSTTTGLPFPHFVRPILNGLHLNPLAELNVVFEERFEAHHLHNLCDHANLSFVPPVAPPLLLPAPPVAKGKSVKTEGPSTSQEQGPLLRSKVDLALLDKIDALTTSVVDVKNELGELKIMLGEKLTELIASLQRRVPASVERDPPPQE